MESHQNDSNLISCQVSVALHSCNHAIVVVGAINRILESLDSMLAIQRYENLIATQGEESHVSGCGTVKLRNNSGGVPTNKV